MKMYPIYNNVGRLLGHVESKTIVNGHNDVTVCEDMKVGPYDPDMVAALTCTTANVCRIPKRQIIFRDAWDEIAHTYLVTDCALPDWFWNNIGCVEFSPEHFKRVPW